MRNRQAFSIYRKGIHIMNENIKRGDIYYANLSPVVGSEQDGIRPVLIIQNDIGNINSQTVIVAAISSKTHKSHLPTQVLIEGFCLPKDSVVRLEHIRTIDKCRILKYIGQLDNNTMKKIDRAIEISFGLNYAGEYTNEK